MEIWTKASQTITSAESPITLTVSCDDGNTITSDTLQVIVGNMVSCGRMHSRGFSVFMAMVFRGYLHSLTGTGIAPVS